MKGKLVQCQCYCSRSCAIFFKYYSKKIKEIFFSSVYFFFNEFVGNERDANEWKHLVDLIVKRKTEREISIDKVFLE